MTIVWQKEKEVVNSDSFANPWNIPPGVIWEKALGKYAATLEENTHAKVWFQ